MHENPAQCLEALKKELQEQAAKRLAIAKDFGDYSGQDISLFQEDLMAVCQSSVSEKWFYTHLKNHHPKLPRIDVLQLLARYCAYASWEEFCQRQKTEKVGPAPNKAKLWLLSLLLILAAVLVFFFWPHSQKVNLRFMDAYTQKEIPFKDLSIILISDDKLAQSLQKAEAKYEDSLEIKGAYYKIQKVFVPKMDTMEINLYPDDYALMLNYFSRSDVQDLKKRQEQLLEAIHPEAKIFQSHPQFQGIELLNREEFIERLLLPIDPLRNLEIQDIIYREGSIYRLRFVQKND